MEGSGCGIAAREKPFAPPGGWTSCVLDAGVWHVYRDLAEGCFDDLKAAPRMVTAPPFSPSLEDLYVPDPDRVAVREVAGAGARA